jgi:hypothetical protein
VKPITIEERVSRIEKIFWVVFIVAVIFGMSGAFGAKILSSAKKELHSLSIQIKNIDEKASKMTALVTGQEKKSIVAVKNQEALSINNLTQNINNATSRIQDSIQKNINQQISNLRVSFNETQTDDCRNPRSGTKNTCRCDEGMILLGVLHADVRDDDKDTEKVVGIVCGTPIIQ